MGSNVDPATIRATAYKDAAVCYGVLSLIHHRYKHVLPDDHMRELVKEAMEAADRMQNAPALVDTTAVEREAARKALAECAEAVRVEDPTYRGTVSAMHILAYLAREYPETRGCVLSDGSVVTYSPHKTHFLVHYEGRLQSTPPVHEWRNLAITGADFETLKAFAEAVR